MLQALCAHLNTVSESVLHKSVVHLVLTLIFWCFAVVHCSLSLPKPCVGDDRSVPFTQVDEHWQLCFLLLIPCGPVMFQYDISPSTLFHSPIMTVFVLPFPPSERILLLILYSSSSSSCLYSKVGMYTCTN